MRHRVVPSLLFGLGCVQACVEQSPDLTPSEREALREYLPSEPPKPSHQLDIRFENKVRLLGYDIDTEVVSPGVPFTITWYWHVQKRLGSGWLQFTHLADGAGNDRLNQDANGVIRNRYQAYRWKAGEYIRDPQTITLPNDWNSDRVVFYLGFWHGEHRLRVSQGPNDGNNRARAASIPVRLEAQGAATPTAIIPGDFPSDIPTLIVEKARGSITIDGNLDETDWQKAVPTQPLVHPISATAEEPYTRVRALWGDEALFLAFEVQDDFIQSTFSKRDEHLWTQDCVEVMVDPDGDGANYFELQVSPKGVYFDTFYEKRRLPQPFGHTNWNPPIEARVALRGQANDRQSDQGYTVEMRIPWAALQHGSSPAIGKPLDGSTWRVAFYVMDIRPDGSQRAVAWSPPREGDFHVPNRFGRLRFVSGETAPPSFEPIELPPKITRSLLESLQPSIKLPPPSLNQPGR
ncbi:MAG: carbohydrate-binding family 9-like protein [Deltaproteobacteria bacterium]|nr:carbohydrate-binding family 9-like protein [Deltaproteobacteria bacterium]